jgi:hypothetical protein
MNENTPLFRELYHLLQDYNGHSLYWDVLYPWLPKAQQAIAELEPYLLRNSSANPYPVTDEDLWQWYALSRINDYLLIGFQVDEDFYQSKRQQGQEWREWMSEVGHRHLTHWNGNVVHPREYADFFASLGFTLYYDHPFHPFYHEIVEVKANNEIDTGEIAVGYVYWPGLMFGDMMFSRSGVRVLCRPGTFNKRVAENSRYTLPSGVGGERRTTFRTDGDTTRSGAQRSARTTRMETCSTLTWTANTCSTRVTNTPYQMI